MTLTREQLEAMTDVELDEVVATEVMGWELRSIERAGYDELVNAWFQNDRFIKWAKPWAWSPSTSWSAMGEVLEKLLSLGLRVVMHSKQYPGELKWNAEVWNDTNKSHIWCVYNTLPRAFAIAAVLAVLGANDG